MKYIFLCMYRAPCIYFLFQRTTQYKYIFFIWTIFI